MGEGDSNDSFRDKGKYKGLRVRKVDEKGMCKLKKK